MSGDVEEMVAIIIMRSEKLLSSGKMYLIICN